MLGYTYAEEREASAALALRWLSATETEREEWPFLVALHAASLAREGDAAYWRRVAASCVFARRRMAAEAAFHAAPRNSAAQRRAARRYDAAAEDMSDRGYFWPGHPLRAEREAAAAALTEDSPQRLRAKMARDPWWRVRYLVARSPTPWGVRGSDRVLARLAKDDDPAVAVAAAAARGALAVEWGPMRMIL